MKEAFDSTDRVRGLRILNVLNLFRLVELTCKPAPHGARPPHPGSSMVAAPEQAAAAPGEVNNSWDVNPFGRRLALWKFGCCISQMFD